MPPRVLCVDDEPLALRAMRRSLEADGELRVEVASSAAEARRLLLAGDYAVLLSDYAMEDESGVDLIASVAGRCDAVPILITAHAEMDVATEAINRGHIYGFVAKPFDERVLRLLVQRAAEHHRLQRALREKIAELERANAELERAHGEIDRLSELAATDEKTGVSSYRFFRARLDEEVARARRYALPLSLLLVDLDGFKAVNDRHGHLVGDRVLGAVAGMLRSSVRVMDVVARFGGDEFALILPNTTVQGATVLGERLRCTVRDTALAPARAGDITISMGLAALPAHPAEDGPALVALADAALYRAKQQGRDRCAVAQAS